MSDLYKVSVLKFGSLIRGTSGEILDARSSVTLISSGNKKIIVDTGLGDEGGKIIDALARKGLWPEDIDIVINTHGDPDHCGNNHLFSRAELLKPKEGDIIAPGVWAMETPGHTMDSISIVVDASAGLDTTAVTEASMDSDASEVDGAVRVIVIAGDALPNQSNFLKKVPPALHVDRGLAVSSMSRIIEIADIVVPGHDRPFSVADGKYTLLDY